ncbi:MAG: hypothetical protein CSB48_00935 [Proteobacteria bacterium]|nr:MAG: hypothetical protein CSB48_00935 [Pseudomonadota bacterium]PIE40340.1 MAG: hypothetical protein CSA51_01245 [Gammaproteobacteria bacterium]
MMMTRFCSRLQSGYPGEARQRNYPVHIFNWGHTLASLLNCRVCSRSGYSQSCRYRHFYNKKMTQAGNQSVDNYNSLIIKIFFIDQKITILAE